MNIDELYQGMLSFWNKISPLLYFHFFALLVLVWIYGKNWYLLERIEYFLKSERYIRWKKFFDEFSLRPVIPYVVVIVFFLYLSFFNNVLGMFGGSGVLSIVYSQTELWQESHALNQLVEVASYQSNSDIKLWEVYEIKQKFLEEYKTLYPEKYQSVVNWISEDNGTWIKRYKLSLLFLIFSIVLLIIQLKDKKNRTRKIFKIAGIIILTIAAAIFFRIKAEQNIEKSVKTELVFVNQQLRLDPYQKINKMNDSDIRSLECNIYYDITNSVNKDFDTLWISRLFEKLSLLSREIIYMTDAEFQNQYGYLENTCEHVP